MIITYGGVEITKYLRPTRELDRKILPEVNHRLTQIGNSDGVRHLGTSYGKRTISMPFKITNDLIKNRRDLARVLGTREVLPLVFSDEPDKYWDALPTGDISVTEMVMLGTGTIEWVIPDGVAHAIDPRVFSNTDLSVSASNQVLDPEFKNKDKYYKTWTGVLNEQYKTSNILCADFTNTYTVAGTNEFVHKGFYSLSNTLVGIRHFPNMKKGDKVSFGCTVKTEGATSIDKSCMVLLQELRNSGGGGVKTYELKPSSLSTDFQTLKQTITISSDDTKYLRLVLLVYPGTKACFTQPQYNLGATLATYSETKATYNEYIAVTNSGSFRAWPIIRATMNGDNGLVALLNQDKSMLQFGNAEETDIVEGVKSDKVINIPMRYDADKFEVNSAKAKPVYPNFLFDSSRPNIVAGSWNWDIQPDTVAPVYEANSTRVWSGPTLYTAIKSNRENSYKGDFLWRNRLNFESNLETEGRATLTLQNASGPVLSVVVRDSSSGSAHLVIEFWYKDTIINSRELNMNEWSGDFWEIDIRRSNGSNIEFKFSSVDSFYNGDDVKSSKNYIYTVNYAELATTDISALCFWACAFETSPEAYIRWTDTKFDWINEKSLTKIPNTFNDGDILELDIKNRLVRLNGVENNYLHALGNQWEHFAIEPGTTTMLPVCSSWANMFQLDVELREAYL